MSASRLEGFEAHRVIREAEAAKFAGLSLPHFRALRYQKKGPAYVKLGSRHLGYRQGDLVEWLEKRLVAAKESV